MADFAVKKRMMRAKNKEKKRCEKRGATIINSDNEITCFIANYGTHEDKIRVVLDKITKTDIELMCQINALPNQSRQISCYIRGERDPILIEIKDDSRIRFLYNPTSPALKNRVLSTTEFFNISNPAK